MACRTVTALAPTLVPKALETSCAPMAQAMANAMVEAAKYMDMVRVWAGAGVGVRVLIL